MTLYYAFNGDADGLCALQQLRLANPREAALVTGVKRDIALLGRVPAAAGDECIVLDVSLDVNRGPLLELLSRGVSVRYFDHHHAGEVPDHPRLETFLDPSPEVCTSLLVDRYLAGKYHLWAITGAFGDSLTTEATALSDAFGLAAGAVSTLRELGVCLNHNAYGETVADLHVPPAELAERIAGYRSPLDLAESDLYRLLAGGYHDDMQHAARLEPTRRAPGAILFVLPDAAWARRASGSIANDRANAHPDSAIAVLTPKAKGGYVVSVRVPVTSSVAADAFCRRYETGGGRRTAAGINHLPPSDVERFAADFVAELGGR